MGESSTAEVLKQVPGVDHYFWLAAGLAADEMGVDVPAICGAWERPPGWDGQPDDKGLAEAIVTAEPDTCPACLKVLERHVLWGLA